MVEGEVVKPECKRILWGFERPAVAFFAVLPEPGEDIAVKEVSITGPVEMVDVASIIFESEGEQAVEIMEDGRRVNVAASDIVQCARIVDELECESRGVAGFLAHATGGSAIVELCTKDTGVEMGIVCYR